ncbi:hypothetical protein IQ07DRAFT_54030 [Pyrenochaeta sp. DS3sAY3a]|nr:hypothetical protein IQ07DRAFT_54030 [Pyrenochaeta sp. DS3sAY3a]
MRDLSPTYRVHHTILELRRSLGTILTIPCMSRTHAVNTQALTSRSSTSIKLNYPPMLRFTDVSRGCNLVFQRTADPIYNLTFKLRLAQILTVKRRNGIPDRFNEVFDVINPEAKKIRSKD